MIFDEIVSPADRARIIKALEDIEFYGNRQQQATARFIFDTDILIYVDSAEKVKGSGSVFINKILGASWAILRGAFDVKEAAGFIRLNIARETIDTGGQRGIEGTLVHEGKHARDFALMLATFSARNREKYFNPTAFQREYSAHLTSAFYLMRRGGEYTDEGVDLGLLFRHEGKISINRKGIRARLKNNYGLTKDTPGKRLNEMAFPKIYQP